MSVLVFCSTKKWCQQTAGLLAKELMLSDRSGAGARAAEEAKRAHDGGRGDTTSLRRGGKASTPCTGLVPGASVALAATAAGAAPAKCTHGLPLPLPPSGARVHEEGAAAAATARQDGGAGDAPLTTAKQGIAGENSRRAAAAMPAVSPSVADAIREQLRQTPVGLDAELSYLVGCRPLS